MRNIEIPLPEQVDCADVEAAIDHALQSLDLTTTMRGTLKKYPGCIHWHAKSGRRPGTVEITLWPQQCRAWFSVQSGRNGDWIAATMAALAKAIARELALDER